MPAPPERLLAAIGEPQFIDTSRDERLGRIFMNRTIRVYPAFAEFYGMEETVERIVSFFRHAAQGLEERRQILYLLGPVGGGKSSLAERLKALMEEHPIYVLKAGRDISPVFESPLGLFDPEQMGDTIEKRYGIPRRRISGLMSPWCLKRLDEFGGDISRFSVAKVRPSRLRQIAVAKTEPGDENNQDISSLVGKVDIRKLETLAQNDPDAYSYSGGLNRANQGILEFVEMFKAPIKMLHPLLTATQEGNYIGTENIGAIPFSGVILAHSNEAEWQAFKNNKNNEAFIDRIYVIKVPYCLRVAEEQKIYEKLIRESELDAVRCAPGDARDAGPLLRAVAAARSTRTRTTSPRCASMTARPCARSIRAPAACRNTATRPASTRAWTASRPASPSRCWRRPSTTTPPRSRPIRFTSCMCWSRRSAASRCRRTPRSAISSSSRPSWRRAMPSSSATRSRRPISNRTTTTARTCSTATSIMPTPGSRIRTSRTPIPASSSTASC